MRQMKQPRKDVLREQLAAAAEEIIELRQIIDTMRMLNGWGREPEQESPSRWRRLLQWGRRL